MRDISQFTATGKVVKIISHKNGHFNFLLNSRHGDDVQYVCRTVGKAGDYLPGRIMPGDELMITGGLLFKKGAKYLNVFTAHLIKKGFGRNGLKPKVKGSLKPQRMAEDY